MSYRRQVYKKRWKELVAMYGGTCYYCHKEAATTIDHVIPLNWEYNNDPDNLVPACALCNSIAGDKMFDSIEHKRQYILSRRKKKKNRRAICVECLLPFSYRLHSPSMLLCALCYDEEYETDFATKHHWRNWVIELREAGISVKAHQEAKRRLLMSGRKYARDRKALTQLIVDEYSKILEQDEDFALFLSV